MYTWYTTCSLCECVYHYTVGKFWHMYTWYSTCSLCECVYHYTVGKFWHMYTTCSLCECVYHYTVGKFWHMYTTCSLCECVYHSLCLLLHVLGTSTFTSNMFSRSEEEDAGQWHTTTQSTLSVCVIVLTTVRFCCSSQHARIQQADNGPC